MRPLLELPSDPAAWSGWLRERVEGDLAGAADRLARITDGTSRTPGEVLSLWDAADRAVRTAGSLTSALPEVHPDPDVRTIAEDLAQDVSRSMTERGLDRELYAAVAATDEPADPGARRLRAHVLRDFRRSGVDRDEPTRARLREIHERTTVLEQTFARNIRDDVRTVRLRPEQLDGLPADYREAHPPGDDGLVAVTTEYPDAVPFRQFAHDAEARRRLTTATWNRGWPVNEAVLTELLALRAELAGLLGYPDWPSYDAEVKMIGTGAAIPAFIDEVAGAAEPRARLDLERLRARAGTTSLTRADSAYWTEVLRREDYDVDAQRVRRYFAFDRVRDGLLSVTSALFGVEYVARPDVPTWHADVDVHDVRLDGEVIGRIYLDLHPREGKFSHAACFDLVPGVLDEQLAEGMLACNVPRGLLDHDDVVTLFHEFGHLVHHVLAGRQQWARFSGIATEWDFVEAPSQMLEEWAWDAAVLRTFAVDEDGAAIPADLVARMRAADELGKGLTARTQMFYAAVSYRLHRDLPTDLTAAVDELHAQYDVQDPLPDVHFHAGFGHLTEYTSAYYTYMWSLVIAKDLFSAFDPGDLMAPQVAHRYRDAVLAPGGSADADDLVAAFLGRRYTIDSFRRWLGAD
jgi:thimet oligopeptidase